MPSDLKLPARMAKLPVNDAGYPVPWFVAWIDGKPDFRIIERGRMAAALTQDKCWVCGERRSAPTASFVIGPMCAVNRVSAEPPSHYECATYAARACPFLANPKKRRREGHMPEERVDAPGMMIARNPGVALVWTSRHWKPFQVPREPGMGPGVLFDVGEPTRVAWYAYGREATREEVLASIDSGLPILLAEAEKEGPEAMKQLHWMRDRAMAYLPA
jgi:hypothetical protein